MNFAHFSHVWNKPGMTAAARYDQLWRELELADESGFDFGFCVEHHFNPRESWMPSPSIYCAAAAAHTRRLRIGTMGNVVPLYDPLRIAESAPAPGAQPGVTKEKTQPLYRSIWVSSLHAR